MFSSAKIISNFRAFSKRKPVASKMIAAEATVANIGLHSVSSLAVAPSKRAPSPVPLTITNEASLILPFLLQSHKFPHVLICPVKRNGKLYRENCDNIIMIMTIMVIIINIISIIILIITLIGNIIANIFTTINVTITIVTRAKL